MTRRNDFFDIDPFREFEEMQEEMKRMFNQFNDMQTNAPKELIREYQTSDGVKVREVGPIVYGYSMTVGPDGKPKVTEFGNLKYLGVGGGGGAGFRIGERGSNPQIIAEREPLADVNTTDKEIIVTLEMPGIKKEEIKINAYEGEVEVVANNPQRKYHKTIELPHDADIETAKSSYQNGILEVTFNKKEITKSKGKEIKIE
ncbi:MAG: Hsp20/alpha crystallin family protein [Nitrosopumilus sp.]|nr:Hsp20/alpha crystallin family protein [Nitrosopumilus sp.]